MCIEHHKTETLTQQQPYKTTSELINPRKCLTFSLTKPSMHANPSAKQNSSIEWEKQHTQLA